MKKEVKETKKLKELVKEVTVLDSKEDKVDRRMFNPGRPKSKESQQQDEFVNNLLNGDTFTVKGLDGKFKISKQTLYKNNNKSGDLTNVYPSKLKFKTTTLIGNTVDYVIKFKDINLKK